MSFQIFIGNIGLLVALVIVAFFMAIALVSLMQFIFGTLMDEIPHSNKSKNYYKEKYSHYRFLSKFIGFPVCYFEQEEAFGLGGDGYVEFRKPSIVDFIMQTIGMWLARIIVVLIFAGIFNFLWTFDWSA